MRRCAGRTLGCWLVAGAIGTGLAAGGGSVRAQGTDSVATSSSPVMYMANREYPLQIIRSLAYAQGLQVAPGASERASRSQVSGRLTADSLTDLLNQLGRSHGFEHFIHGATLYLYDPTDWRTSTIALGYRPDDTLKDALSQYGLLYPQFKWMAKPEQEALVLTAPRQYIALVEQALKVDRPSSQTDMMVFRLQYASVEDRVLSLRDRQVVTPGVATLLRGILFGQSQQTSMASASPSLAPSGQSMQFGQAGQSAYALPGLGSGSGAALAPALSAMPSLGDLPPAASPDRTPAPSARNGVTVQADVRTNSIIIRDRLSQEPAYRRLIQALDVPADMIEIEAVLIDIDQKRLDELGVQWSLGNNRVSIGFPTNSAAVGLGVDGSTAIVTDRTGFVARLQALVADNDARVLARPTILTMDNLSAVIDLSQTFYAKVQGERVASVVPVVAGSFLRVSPRIVRDPKAGRGPEVQLQVDIEDGSLKDREGLDLPTVQKNAISTQASILADQSILIGGYTRESEEQTAFKVPLLGDLPILGHLMRSRNTRSQRMTRLFLITPRVVSPQLATSTVKAQVGERVRQAETEGLQVIVPQAANKLSTKLSPVPRRQSGQSVR